jgi:hypothetical protein
MTDNQPVATVDGLSPFAALRDPQTLGSVLVVGVVTGMVVRFSAVGESSPATGMVAGLVATLVAAGALAVREWFRTPAAVRFYRDEMMVDRHFPGGSTTISYDEVDLVVGREKRDGVGSYELVRSGQDPVDVWHVADPATFERVLVDRVPAPAERDREADTGDDTERPIEHERVFWRGWPSDEPLPETPLVGASALPASLDSGIDIPEKHRRGDASGSVEGRWRSDELAAGTHHGAGGGPLDLEDSALARNSTMSGGMGFGDSGGDGGE